LLLSKPAVTLFSDNRRRAALAIISDIPQSGAGADEGAQEGDGGGLEPARWIITSRSRGLMRVYNEAAGQRGIEACAARYQGRQTCWQQSKPPNSEGLGVEVVIPSKRTNPPGRQLG
jgi:hypothetical protein